MHLGVMLEVIIRAYIYRCPEFGHDQSGRNVQDVPHYLHPVLLGEEGGGDQLGRQGGDVP